MVYLRRRGSELKTVELARFVIPFGDEMALVVVRRDEVGRVIYMIPELAKPYVLWTTEPPRVCGIGRLDTETGEPNGQ